MALMDLKAILCGTLPWPIPQIWPESDKPDDESSDDTGQKSSAMNAFIAMRSFGTE